MLIMNNIRVFAAFLVLFCLSKDCESCFSGSHYETVNIARGSTFYKECRCTEPGKGTLRWLDSNNREIPLLRPGTKSNVYAEWRDKSTYSLFISDINKAVSGVYKCVTHYNGQEYSLIYDIQAYDPLYFIQTDDVQYAIKGKDSPIICEPRGGTNLMISWHKEQNLIEANDEKYEITPIGLIIKNVTSEDKGVYKCTALDQETGEGIDIDITVEVSYIPVIDDLVTTPEKTVISGETLSVECKANGWPHPEYTWRRLSNKKDTDTYEGNVTWEVVTNKIIFNSVRPEDQGTYECTASNSAGNTSKKIDIEVLFPPVIMEFNNVTAVEGSTISIVCKAIGRSRPNVTISYEAEEIDDRNTVWKNETIEELSILYVTFWPVHRNHTGIYICNATNEVETISQESKLTVLYKPNFKEESEVVWGWEGHTVNLSCENDSNPPATVSWKYQGNDIPTQEQVAINELLTDNLIIMPILIDKDTMFGIYECTAANELGDAKKFITLQEAHPLPPVDDITILNNSSTSITFGITGPNNIMGPPLLGYTAEYDEASNYNVTDIHIYRTWSKTRPYKIDKLKPNTTYIVKFAAVNNVGAGSWSQNLYFQTLEKSTPEQLIWESDSETAGSDGVLKWKTPDDNGDPIDFYVVRYCPINNGSTIEEECKEERINPTTEFELNRMDANTTYYFEILAHNSLGNSSAANIYVTIPAVPENAPLISAGGIIVIAAVVVLICLVILDVILFVWRRQGIIASCCYKKNKKRIEDTMQSRDKKGLLKDNGESVANDTLKRPTKESEYKHTGIITGKHSAV